MFVGDDVEGDGQDHVEGEDDDGEDGEGVTGFGAEGGLAAACPTAERAGEAAALGFLDQHGEDHDDADEEEGDAEDAEADLGPVDGECGSDEGEGRQGKTFRERDLTAGELGTLTAG